MIVAENPKPSLSEFKELMTKIDKMLNDNAQINSAYFKTRNGTALEEDVYDAALECAKHTKFRDSIQLVSGASFPDIIAAKYYGIEVKSSKSNNWKTIGNSILESTRVSDIERIFITFGKLSDPIGFISRPYEDCLSGIAVTHSPRYQIDMSLSNGDTIFDKMGITYDQLRAEQNPAAIVANYYKSQLKQGESLWWAGGSVDVAVPATVRLWRSLSACEKEELEALIYTYFPETIASNSSRKYDRAALWLATQKGIVCSNIRDLFSAGGQSSMETIDGKQIMMPQVFAKIAEHADLMIEILQSESDENLFENWGEAISKNRIRQWIDLVIRETHDISKRITEKSVLEQIFRSYNVL